MKTAEAIARYLDHCHCLGKRFRTEGAILTAFGKSTGDLRLDDIGSETIMCFLHRGRVSDETVRKKHRTLFHFFRFLVTRRLIKASPMPRLTRQRRSSTYTPYIYGYAELKRLFQAVPRAAGRRTGVDPTTLRHFLLLVYGAGLRRGEALRLTIGDIDGSQSLIHIRATKFFKTRVVPLSASLSRVMLGFLARRHKYSPVELDSPVFCKRSGQPLTSSVVNSAFRRLRMIAGIRRDGGPRNQPRLHDLRHSAAVHRVTAWYRQGADLNYLLPKLATYLGHTDLSGTQRYLTMTHELLREASLRFEAFAGRNGHD